jgi:hypothetical protein
MRHDLARFTLVKRNLSIVVERTLGSSRRNKGRLWQIAIRADVISSGLFSREITWVESRGNCSKHDKTHCNIDGVRTIVEKATNSYPPYFENCFHRYPVVSTEFLRLCEQIFL